MVGEYVIGRIPHNIAFSLIVNTGNCQIGQFHKIRKTVPQEIAHTGQCGGLHPVQNAPGLPPHMARQLVCSQTIPPQAKDNIIGSLYLIKIHVQSPPASFTIVNYSNKKGIGLSGL
ncbi:hypothetical protein D3C73_853120 [compost metagenome]